MLTLWVFQPLPPRLPPYPTIEGFLHPRKGAGVKNNLPEENNSRGQKKLFFPIRGSLVLWTVTAVWESYSSKDLIQSRSPRRPHRHRPTVMAATATATATEMEVTATGTTTEAAAVPPGERSPPPVARSSFAMVWGEACSPREVGGVWSRAPCPGVSSPLSVDPTSHEAGGYGPGRGTWGYWIEAWRVCGRKRTRCGAEGALGNGEGKIREAAIQKSLLQ